MVSFHILASAVLACVTVPVTSRALGDRCGWLGCPVESSLQGLVEQHDNRFEVTDAGASQIVQDIQALTVKSQSLQAPAQSVSVVNGPLLVIGAGPFPAVISGIVEVVTIASSSYNRWQSIKPITKSEEVDAIYDAYRDFVKVHSLLVSILIGKSSLFPDAPWIKQPLSAVLRQDEAVVDAVAFSLADLVQSRGSDVQSLATSLNELLNRAIKAYEL